MLTLNSFPPEVLEKIFIHLDSISISMCSQVCRKWRTIINAGSNPLQIPRVSAAIFQHLDTASLIKTRLVCKLWKSGLDLLTANDKILIQAQSSMFVERNEEIISNKDFSNPFPSRVVGLTLIHHECNATIAATSVFRDYGYHIKYLNIKTITYSAKSKALLGIVSNIAKLLPYLTNLQGLSIHISAVFNNSNKRVYDLCKSEDDKNPVPELLRKDLVIPKMDKLTAFRLVAWNFASEITEWLYFEILRNAPNLKFFDPDYYKGYSKFFKIFTQPTMWPFQLTCLKLAVAESVCPEVFKLVRETGFPLTTVYLDVFELSWEKSSKACLRIIQAALKSCAGTIESLAVGFYLASKFIPSASVDISRLLRCKIISKYDENQASCPYLKRSKFHQCKLKYLKLFGFRGSLTFLKDFKQLERLVLIDYNPAEQKVFNCESAFYKNISSLRDLYTPQFGTLNINTPEAKLVDRKYMPIYYW